MTLRQKKGNIGVGIVRIILVLFILSSIVLFPAAPIDGATVTPSGEWVPVANITNMESVLNVDANSRDDTLVVSYRMGITLYGMENHTIVGSANPITDGGYTDSDWNDRMGWIAWVHSGVFSSTDERWNRQVVVFDLDSQLITSLLPVPSNTAEDPATVVDVEWSPDGTQLAVVTRGNEVAVYSIPETSVVTRRTFQGPIPRIAWDPSGTYVAVQVTNEAELTDTVQIFDVVHNETWDAWSAGSRVHDIDWSSNGSETLLLTENRLLGVEMVTRDVRIVSDAGLNAMAASPTEPLIALPAKENLLILDIGTGEVDTYHVGRELTDTCGWTQDGAYLFVVDEAHIIRIWTRQVPHERPRIGISLPLADTTVSGMLDVAGWAIEGSGEPVAVMVRVGLGEWTSADGFHAWTLILDTSTLPDGTTTIRAKALDSGGYSDVAATRVFVSNENANPNDPPQVTITAPTDGTTVWGVVGVTGTASDDRGVVSVQLRFGDRGWQAVEIDASASEIQWALYTGMFSELDALSISARSYDGSMFSDTVTVDVDVHKPAVGGTMPVIEVLRPTTGSTMPPAFNVTGRVVGGDVDTVYVSIDRGPLRPVEPTKLWTARFEDVGEGAHILDVIAGDGSLYSQVVSVYFYVSDELPVADIPPMVGFTSPPSGSFFVEGFTANGWSTDDHSVASVEMRVNEGEWVMADGTSEWSFTVERGDLKVGWNTLDVRAFDGAQYSTVNSTRVNFTPVRSPEPGESGGWVFILLALVIVLIAMLAVLLWRRTK